MRGTRLTVIEPLVLMSVRRFGSNLRLVVRDRWRARFVISFYFDGSADACEHRLRMARWIADRTRLAYVRGPGESELIEIDALLARASA